MGATDAPSLNMRPSYAGAGKLRRSDEAYFLAYLLLWVRRSAIFIVTVTLRQTYRTLLTHFLTIHIYTAISAIKLL